MLRNTPSIAVIALLAAGLLTGCGSASHHNLSGTWTGNSTMVTGQWGFGEGKRTIVIKDQKGSEFVGENSFTFHADGAIPQNRLTNSYDEKTKTVTATKNIIGTIDPKTGKIDIVESGASDAGGRFSGKLIDNDTMVVVFTEPGQYARVFRATLKRQSK